MELKEIQEQAFKVVDEYNFKHNLEHDKNTVLHHLVEEVGELAREIANETNDWRKEGFSKEKSGEEIADVFGQLIYLAKDYNIDLEEAIINKIKKTRKRLGLE